MLKENPHGGVSSEQLCSWLNNAKDAPMSEKKNMLAITVLVRIVTRGGKASS